MDENKPWREIQKQPSAVWKGRPAALRAAFPVLGRCLWTDVGGEPREIRTLLCAQIYGDQGITPVWTRCSMPELLPCLILIYVTFKAEMQHQVIYRVRNEK